MPVPAARMQTDRQVVRQAAYCDDCGLLRAEDAPDTWSEAQVAVQHARQTGHQTRVTTIERTSYFTTD